MKMRRRTWFLWGVIAGHMTFAPFFVDLFGGAQGGVQRYWFASAPWLLALEAAQAREVAHLVAFAALGFFLYTLFKFKHFRVEQLIFALVTAALSAWVPFIVF